MSFVIELTELETFDPDLLQGYIEANLVEKVTCNGIRVQELVDPGSMIVALKLTGAAMIERFDILKCVYHIPTCRLISYGVYDRTDYAYASNMRLFTFLEFTYTRGDSRVPRVEWLPLQVDHGGSIISYTDAARKRVNELIGNDDAYIDIYQFGLASDDAY